MKIVVLLDGYNGVAYHRLFVPFRRIMQVKGQQIYVNADPKTYGQIDWQGVDVVVFNRWMNSLNYNIMEELKKHGVKIILDLDDYWNIPKHNHVYEQYKWHIKDAIKNNMEFADMVWTTTTILQAEIQRHNANVHVIPNALNLAEKQWNIPKKKNENITVGWVGGNSHMEDIKMIRDAIPELNQNHGIDFIMGGHHEGQSFWRAMEQIIYGRKKRPKWFLPRVGVKPTEYGMYYSEIDIAVAPLSPFIHFNRYKSELKIIEAAAYNLPIVVSDTMPYTLHENNNGVLFAKDNDWYTPIDKLILDKDFREYTGSMNWQYCKEHHDLDTINEKRLQLIKSLL